MNKKIKALALAMAMSLLLSPALAADISETSETTEETEQTEQTEQREETESKANTNIQDIFSIVPKINQPPVAGEDFELILSVKNNSDERVIGKISLDNIEGLDEFFEIKEDLSYELQPGQSGDYAFILTPKEGLKEANYPLIVNVNFNEYSLIDKLEIPVKAEMPAFEIPANPDQETINKIMEEVKKGNISLDDIPQDLIGTGQGQIDPSKLIPPNQSPSGGSPIAGMGIPPEALAALQNPPSSGMAGGGQIPADMLASLQGGAGPMPTDIPADMLNASMVGMPSGGGRDMTLPYDMSAMGSLPTDFNGPTGEQVKYKPKLIIDQYSFDPQYPLAGEDFDIELSFFNTNKEKSVRNIKISLTSDEAAIASMPSIPGLTTGQGENTTSSSGGTIFTPVGSSNTLYIDRIDPEKKSTKTITLTTPSTVPTKNYQLVVNFEYEDVDGNQYVAQETIGIPVVQESRLTTSDILVPEENYVGQPVDGEIQFYNTGKDTLYNLMVSVEGNFDNMSLEEYIGNFDSGESSSYLFTLTPKDYGNQRGKIVFTFEDATGEIQTVEEDFEVFVAEGEAPPAEGEMTDEEMMAANNQGLPFSPFFIIGAVIVGVAIIAAILQRRKRKEQEKDLTIDED